MCPFLKTGEGDWERRTGFCFKMLSHIDQFYKKIHIWKLRIWNVFPPKLLFVPIYVSVGLHVNVAQSEDHWCIEKKNGLIAGYLLSLILAVFL